MVLVNIILPDIVELYIVTIVYLSMSAFKMNSGVKGIIVPGTIVRLPSTYTEYCMKLGVACQDDFLYLTIQYMEYGSLLGTTTHTLCNIMV